MKTNDFSSQFWLIILVSFKPHSLKNENSNARRRYYLSLAFFLSEYDFVSEDEDIEEKLQLLISGDVNFN